MSQQSLNQQLLAAMTPMTESASTRRAFEKRETRRQTSLAKKQARAALRPPKLPKAPKAPRLPKAPKLAKAPRYKPYKPPRFF